jgi:hypothetical protein
MKRLIDQAYSAQRICAECDLSVDLGQTDGRGKCIYMGKYVNLDGEPCDEWRNNTGKEKNHGKIA